MTCCINVEGDSHCTVRNDANIIKSDARRAKKPYSHVMASDILDVHVYRFSNFFFNGCEICNFFFKLIKT